MILEAVPRPPALSGLIPTMGPDAAGGNWSRALRPLPAGKQSLSKFGPTSPPKRLLLEKRRRARLEAEAGELRAAGDLVDVQRGDGQTALMLACKNGESGCASVLLQAGASARLSAIALFGFQTPSNSQISEKILRKCASL